MARTKTYNPTMGGLRDMIASYMGKQTEIRAEYARLAEEKLADMRREVLEEMFVVHAGAGASEIANSTGLSRTTVIRWRKEFLDAPPVEVAPEPEPEPQEEDPSYEFGSEPYDGTPTAYVAIGTEQVWLLTGEDFGVGESPYEAEDSKTDRPDWLTDDVMRQAVNETGVKLLLAPWGK